MIIEIIINSKYRIIIIIIFLFSLIFTFFYSLKMLFFLFKIFNNFLINLNKDYVFNFLNYIIILFSFIFSSLILKNFYIILPNFILE